MVSRTHFKPLYRALFVTFLLTSAASFAASDASAVSPAPAAVLAADAPAEAPTTTSEGQAEAAPAAEAPAAAAPVAPTPSASAPAASPAKVEQKLEAPASKHAPYRGSRVDYGHGMTALTVARNAEPYYNPTWNHHLDLSGEWHFGEHLFTRAVFSLGQELTLSDDTTYTREVVASDLTLEAGGEKIALPMGVRVSAAARMTAPTSKTSQAQTRLFTLGPTAMVSRNFALMSGLTVAYSGRFDLRFNRYTTASYASTELPVCAGGKIDCQQDFTNTGLRNAWGAAMHGPRVFFAPIEPLSVVGYFQFSYQWLYPLSAPAAGQPNPSANVSGDDQPVRYANRFGLIAAYSVTKELSVSLNVDTASNQLGPDGKYRQPFFNRNTTLGLDVSVELEPLISRF